MRGAVAQSLGEPYGDSSVLVTAPELPLPFCTSRLRLVQSQRAHGHTARQGGARQVASLPRRLRLPYTLPVSEHIAGSVFQPTAVTELA